MESKDNFKNLRNYILGLKSQLLETDIEKKEQCIETLNSIYKQIETPIFRIGFLSTFSTGKSTIINALLGKEILPVAEKSTTACITTISRGEQDEVEIILNDRNKAIKYLFRLNSDFERTFTSKNRFLDNCQYKCIYNFSKIRQYLDNNILISDESILKLDFTNIEDEYQIISRIKELNPISSLPFRNDKIYKIENEGDTEEEILVSDIFFSEYEKRNLAKIKNEINLLENILLKRKIYIEEISRYREGNFKCSLIKEIKIKLKDFNLKENVELIDLPGVNVSNDKHIDITKEMSERVNAFVFIEAEMKVEGDLKKIAENVKNKFPNIYNYSYLLKNKMAYLKGDEKNFDEKMLNFDILRKELGFKEENTFKIDALKYLSKEDLDEDYCIQFKNFKDKLEKDSQELLIKEFIKMIKFDTTSIYKRVVEELDKTIGSISYFDIEDKNKSREIYIAEEINSKIENYKNYINISIEKVKDYKLSKIDEENWDTQNNNMILEEIKIKEKPNNYYLKKIKEGKDVNKISFDKVFDILFTEYSLNENIRKIYYSFIVQLFYNNFKRFLEETFEEKNLKYLPEKQKIKLKEVFNRGIKERLSGAIDIILYSYEDFREKAKSRLELVYNCLYSTKENLDEHLENLNNNREAFEYFTEKESFNQADLKEIYNINSNDKIELDICKKLLIKEIKNYLEGNIEENINKYTKAIIKNYLEDVIIELEKILQLKDYEAEYRINITSELKERIEEAYNKKKAEIEKKEKEKENLIKLYEDVQI